MKQQKILNAALHEFAEKGYALASTNQIVRRAGIVQGLLREPRLFLPDELPPGRSP